MKATNRIVGGQRPIVRSLFGILIFLFTFQAALTTVRAQAGGTFEIKQSTIAGGGSGSTGGIFGVEGSVGQPAAGSILSGGEFALLGGFWTPSILVPTAAPVTVSGRVTYAGGVGRRNVFVELLNAATGEIRSARPNIFGYFLFQDVQVGSYILSARSRTYSFIPAQRVVDLTQDLVGADFVARPGK